MYFIGIDCVNGAMSFITDQSSLSDQVILNHYLPTADSAAISATAFLEL